MGLKIFITGTSGYLGSVLASGLSALTEIENITGIDNQSPRVSLPEKVRFLKMDIRSPEITQAMKGHDFVIHTACIVQWPAKIPKKIRDDINLNGARNVARAAVENKVRGFLQASSCAAYDPALVQGKNDIDEDFPLGKGKSSFYYWNTKSMCEKILSETISQSDTVLTLFRMGTIIGPNGTITLDELRRNAIRIPGLDPRIQYIQEEDAVSAFVQALRIPMKGAYNVVPDDYVLTSEFHKIIGATPVKVSLWPAVFVSYIRWRFFGSIIHPSWIRAYLMDFTLSNKKLKSTGWTPKYTSAEAVRSVLPK